MLDHQLVWFGENEQASLGRLCPAFQERACAYRSETARQQSVEAYTLLEQLLKKHHIETEDITQYENGKWKIGNYFVSLTHTSTGAGALISTENASIDMEAVRPVSERLVCRTLNEKEQERYENAEDKDLCFITAWTVKEAWIKLQTESGTPAYRSIDSTVLKARSFVSHDTVVTIMKEAHA